MLLIRNLALVILAAFFIVTSTVEAALPEAVESLFTALDAKALVTENYRPAVEETLEFIKNTKVDMIAATHAQRSLFRAAMAARNVGNAKVAEEARQHAKMLERQLEEGKERLAFARAKLASYHSSSNAIDARNVEQFRSGQRNSVVRHLAGYTAALRNEGIDTKGLSIKWKPPVVIGESDRIGKGLGEWQHGESSTGPSLSDEEDDILAQLGTIDDEEE